MKFAIVAVVLWLLNYLNSEPKLYNYGYVLCALERICQVTGQILLKSSVFCVCCNYPKSKYDLVVRARPSTLVQSILLYNKLHLILPFCVFYQQPVLTV